jgi:BASS family bile acid:Na+ symporter
MSILKANRIPVMQRVPWLLAALLLVLSLALFLSGKGALAGRFVMGFFLALAVAFQRHEKLQGFSFTAVIFAAVACAMYYPSLFIQWGDFKLSGLIIPLVQLIMFGMGVSMSLSDFASVARSPKGVLIGVVAQFLIMPSLGYAIAKASGFPPEVAAGVILIGCSPSGLASNVMSYLAKANVPLSLTVTSVTTLLAPFVTPLLMERLAGTYIEIDPVKMMWDIAKMILLPIGAGLLVNRLLYGRTAWLDRAMPLLSMASIAMIIVVITAAGRDSLLSIGPQLIGWVLIHNLAGYGLGYGAAKALRMSEKDSRTVALEVGMQNGGLASGIAKELGKIATVGLAPAVFGPLMNITGSILASYWHRRPPDSGREEGKD